ncbi:MAG: FAD-binding oxidoreductase, partial [Desulfuromonadales bacterium]|nr:FAD-binding oxidoreductase [Desulfuromonadales bacterium]NIS40624.1 FAD-binding oxidoreductase [Desulfuromonadales bacterium]
FGAKRALTEKEDLLTFGYDATPGLQGLPDIVLFPESSEEVGFAVALANQEGIPVIPRGSGTGLSGGSIAPQGGIVLCLTKMNRILEIDEENLTATV